ncbi:MAG: hypothetical protein EPN59_11050 [Paraburkholderia sp.]|uniref:hypothetical protein n=1 Tax=Paraburkholderia sp. TaxID=1926495 RepID=UPI00120BCAF6|nr:hypothetical protein [Paraburkholderia sp.]TAM29870.1 MAG: hypothetical protein EPN59_11050 [Paraburkholderia sp.]
MGEFVRKRADRRDCASTLPHHAIATGGRTAGSAIMACLQPARRCPALHGLHAHRGTRFRFEGGALIGVNGQPIFGNLKPIADLALAGTGIA